MWAGLKAWTDFEDYSESLKTFRQSDNLRPRASMIFLLVSILHGLPLSILSIVRGDSPAFLANSAFDINCASLISLSAFLFFCATVAMA